jgi:hypothetical protein
MEDMMGTEQVKLSGIKCGCGGTHRTLEEWRSCPLALRSAEMDPNEQAVYMFAATPRPRYPRRLSAFWSCMFAAWACVMAGALYALLYLDMGPR